MGEDYLRRFREYMEKNDRLFSLLGAKIVEVSAGYAKVALKVQEKHLNALNVCQGGVIFTLADLAFALASNSHGKVAVALDVSITYLKSVLEGEDIFAEAREIHLGNRTATYIMTVKNSKEEIVAIAKGTVFRIERPFNV
ncbi:MAG: hotdog fold thioesterase [Archaeoglobales archaeon]|nr:hotdog fold thioesterase [Archaeoglobales archaeon]